jgi:hypothetical protein
MVTTKRLRRWAALIGTTKGERAARRGNPLPAPQATSAAASSMESRPQAGVAEAHAVVEALAASLPPGELNRAGFQLSERFRPDVPEGAQGEMGSCGWSGFCTPVGDLMRRLRDWVASLRRRAPRQIPESSAQFRDRHPSTGDSMAFEYRTAAGVVLLIRTEQRWWLYYSGLRHGYWNTPDAAAIAVAQHQTGLPRWDRSRNVVPADLLDWRPLGESL